MLLVQQLVAFQGNLGDTGQSSLVWPAVLPSTAAPAPDRDPSGLGPSSGLDHPSHCREHPPPRDEPAPAPCTSWMTPSKPEDTAAARASLLKSGAPPMYSGSFRLRTVCGTWGEVPREGREGREGAAGAAHGAETRTLGPRSTPPPLHWPTPSPASVSGTQS